MDQVAQDFICLDIENLLFISINFETWKAIRILKTLLLQIIVSASVIKFNWQTKSLDSHQLILMVSLQNGELSLTNTLS